MESIEEVRATTDTLRRAGKRIQQYQRETAALRDEIEQYRKCLQWYADGNHMGFSPECDWENVSGEPPNWLQNNRSEDYEMIEDGGVARKVLAGEKIDWSELDEETETTKNTAQNFEADEGHHKCSGILTGEGLAPGEHLDPSPVTSANPKSNIETAARRFYEAGCVRGSQEHLELEQALLDKDSHCGHYGMRRHNDDGTTDCCDCGEQIEPCDPNKPLPEKDS